MINKICQIITFLVAIALGVGLLCDGVYHGAAYLIIAFQAIALYGCREKCHIQCGVHHNGYTNN